MKIVFRSIQILLCLFSMTALTPPQEIESIRGRSYAFESDGLIKMSASLFVSAGADGFSFGLETPSFFSYSMHEGHLNDKLGVFVEYDAIRLRNIVTDEESAELDTSRNSLFSLGLIRRSYHQKNVATIAKIGASFIDADQRLSSKPQYWGATFSFGLEYLHKASYLWKHHSNHTSSLFLEVSYTTTKIEADKLAGNPTLFDDIALSFGFREFY